MKTFFNWTSILSLFSLSYSLQPVRYINGGYTGTTIAIHSKVPESETLLTNLQDLLTRSSKFIHDASEQRFQFDQIDIIIPKTWTFKTNYTPISGSYFGKAHVRVGLTDPNRGDEPFTFQPRECGQVGEFIRLSSQYLEQLNGKSKEQFGEPSNNQFLINLKKLSFNFQFDPQNHQVNILSMSGRNTGMESSRRMEYTMMQDIRLFIWKKEK
jgi:hypothetical protein